MSSSVLRSSSLMAAGTMTSRVTGYLRDIVMVGAIGTAVFADTYNVANTVPNALYILLIGGALNSVLVPQIVRAMKNDADGGEAYANRLISASLIVLVAVTVLAVLLAPLVISIYAPTYTKSGAHSEFATAVVFARYLLPQILFYGIFVIFGQVLNARGRFGPMMWAPIVNNIVVIATGLLFIFISHSSPTASTVTSRQLAILGVGTTLGVVIQSIVLIPYLRASGFRLRPRFDLRGTGLGNAYRAAGWTVLFVLINQIGFLVITQVTTAAATAAAKAGISTGVGFTPYTKAYLILLLPHAIVTVSIVTALLPKMSRAAAESDYPAVREDLAGGIRLASVVIVPASLAFLALGTVLAPVMYATARQQDSHYIGLVLMGFALGLLPFSLHYLMLRGFYAFEDTRTPVTINVWINASNILFAVLAWLILPPKWVVVGVACGYSVSYAVGAAISARKLGRRIGGLDLRAVLPVLGKVFLAATAAALPAFILARGLSMIFGTGLASSLAAALTAGALMAALYLMFAARLRVSELTSMIGVVRGRLSR